VCLLQRHLNPPYSEPPFKLIAAIGPPLRHRDRHEDREEGPRFATWQFLGRRAQYILAANRHLRYKNGRSRIIYIGTTGKGSARPAASAVNTASKVFGEVHGVKTIEAHIATCSPRRNLPTWKRLESSLLDTFFNRYFEPPKYNKVRPKPTVGLFAPSALLKLIRQFEP